MDAHELIAKALLQCVKEFLDQQPTHDVEHGNVYVFGEKLPNGFDGDLVAARSPTASPS